MTGQLQWFAGGGILLGAAFLFTVALVKPIGGFLPNPCRALLQNTNDEVKK